MDNDIIRNNVVAGASGRAIKIDGSDGNTVANNSIGTRGDGTVPAKEVTVAAKNCLGETTSETFILEMTSDTKEIFLPCITR